MKKHAVIFQPLLRETVSGKNLRRRRNSDQSRVRITPQPLRADGPAESGGDAQEKLRQLASRSNKILFHAAAVFPFDLFPTEIVIDELKVTIIHRYFIASERTHSIEIRDIEQVQVETAPLFATFSMTSRTGEVYRIKYLTKQDAIEAHRIIQGLIIGERQHIEFDNVQTGILKRTLEEIGKGKVDDRKK